MTQHILFALIGFAFVSSITPGPNNMMLMASGANFGFYRSIRHLLGVGLGHSFMILVLGTGLIQIFEAYPVTLVIMKWASVAYLVYLAWKIANSAPKPAADVSANAKPLTFLQAAAFQWVNPKGWMMALTAITVYTANQSLFEVAIVALTFLCTNLPSITFWLILGQQARRFLSTPGRLRTFNIVMAALLLASLWPIVYGH